MRNARYRMANRSVNRCSARRPGRALPPECPLRPILRRNTVQKAMCEHQCRKNDRRFLGQQAGGIEQAGNRHPDDRPLLARFEIGQKRRQEQHGAKRLGGARKPKRQLHDASGCTPNSSAGNAGHQRAIGDPAHDAEHQGRSQQMQQRPCRRASPSAAGRTGHGSRGTIRR